MSDALVRKPLQYVEMEPAPELAHLVVTYWGFTVHALPSPGFVHRVWPDGCVTLALASVRGRPAVSVVVGACTTATEVPVYAGEQKWGIRFRPEAGGVCCRRSATSLRNARIEARDVFGDAIDSVIAPLTGVSDAEHATEILNRWMQQLQPFPDRVDSLVRDAVRCIVDADGTGPILGLANTLGVSLRHLQRRFRAATGMTPKEYASIRRARAALKRMANGEASDTSRGLARLAAELGYADQAHLTRECTRLMSFSPTVLSDRLEDIAHDRLVD